MFPIFVIVYEDCDFNCTELESPKNRNSTNLIKAVLLNNSLCLVFIIYICLVFKFIYQVCKYNPKSATSLNNNYI